MKKSIIHALTWLLTVLSGSKAAADGARGQTRDFDAKVAPILARRCLDCHSGADPKGKLDLSRRASALRGGEERAGDRRRASPTKACSGSGSSRTRCRPSRRFPRPRRPRCGIGSPRGQPGAPIRSIRFR